MAPSLVSRPPVQTVHRPPSVRPPGVSVPSSVTGRVIGAPGSERHRVTTAEPRWAAACDGAAVLSKQVSGGPTAADSAVSVYIPVCVCVVCRFRAVDARDSGDRSGPPRSYPCFVTILRRPESMIACSTATEGYFTILLSCYVR